MTDAAAGDAPCEALPWDSAHFGLRIGRMTTRRPGGDEMARALAWCREEAIDCLYLLADAGDPATVRRAEAAGFGLVDVRVTFERGLDGSSDLGAQAPAVVIRAAVVPDDLPALGDLAAAAHRGTRFFNDPAFPDGDCEGLYRAWIEGSALGRADAVLVAEAPAPEGSGSGAVPGGDGAAGGEPVSVDAVAADTAARQLAGYVTCHLAEHAGSTTGGGPSGRLGSANRRGAAARLGSIGLIGVGARHRGSGLGAALVAAALDWLAAHGAGRAEVVTQGANVAAQRLYQRAGFVTREVGLWYHLWPRRPRPAGAAPASGGVIP